jgi:hypothetical protein
MLVVLIGTGIAGLRGQLPGAEPAPYILRFDEDRPNPLYRRVCYTFAWNAALNFALLNLIGLVLAALTGVWYMKQIYGFVYFPLCASSSSAAHAAGCPASALPPKEGHGAPLLLRHRLGRHRRPNRPPHLLEDPAPHRRPGNRQLDQALRLHRRPALHGILAYRGKLHRTRPILPGEVMVE